MSDLIHVEGIHTDFFVTGDEYMHDALDLKFIPRAKLCTNNMAEEVILAADNQDLQQSYLIAKSVFERTKPNTIKFVLIGLSPYAISDNEPPTVQTIDEKVLKDYFNLCLDNGAKPVCVALPVHSALKKNYNADVLKLFRSVINKVIRGSSWKANFIDLLNVSFSDKRFQDKSHFTSEGKAMVTALLSERLFFKDIISPQEILNANEDFFNILSKYFSRESSSFWCDDRPLPHHIFCKMACEDFNRLSKILPKETCMDLMVCVFSELTYSYLASLAKILPKDDYNELTTRLFNVTKENICRKDKIKVGFYFDFSSHWCGDDLYNLFAQDERFEPTIFLPIDKGNELNRNEFLNDSKRFKARGLNVFEMKVASTNVPEQNILFRFYPYGNEVLPAFRLTNLKVKETLLVHFPYSFPVLNAFVDSHLFHVLWKHFLPSTVRLEKHEKFSMRNKSTVIYSGYPKSDVFFKPSSKFHFDWKMARPDAKKIIWAPHWTIDNKIAGTGNANFQWNHKFMYEFAKAHPEISWVVKPHPLLFMSAIWSKLFPSKEALNEYFKKWDDLPNARFYTGAYYQDIFATSDGIIHDCCSFVAEYQYVDKPMIYLTRYGSSKWDKLGEAILNASYLVEGKDLDGISAMIKRVFIEGDDYKAAERKEVFDKYLNYLKINGMLASEFIFKNISQELLIGG